MNERETNAYSQQIIDAIAQVKEIDSSELDLRIRYGKHERLVFGELASGEWRDEVTEDRANLILTALAKPAIAHNDDNFDQRSMLEISNHGEVLFRQERDGTVSANNVQLQATLTSTSMVWQDTTQQQISQMPNSNSKAFLQSLIQDLSQPGQLALQTVELTGKGLERVGQWLASRPEAIRAHYAAKAAYEVFEQGYARTAERSYEHHGFKVQLQGRNQLTLSDTTTGQELLRFKAEKALFGDIKLTILAKSEGGISGQQYQAITQMGQDMEGVRGSEIAEARHAQRSAAFASAARMVTQFNQTNDFHGKHFRIQTEQDSLTITAKDGRGVIYQEQDNQIQSRLEQQDFRRFAQAMKLAQVQQTQIQERTQPQLEIG
jgi:hypothetical protein